MTENDKLYRENVSMRIFTFYLDDLTKLRCIKKLKELGLTEAKGTLSALIRTLLSEFAEKEVSDLSGLTDKIRAEYMLTTKKNKRSSL